MTDTEPATATSAGPRRGRGEAQPVRQRGRTTRHRLSDGVRIAQVRAAHGEPTTEPDMDRFSGGRTLDLDESGVSEVADVGWREA